MQQQVKNQNQRKYKIQTKRDFIWIFSLTVITLSAIFAVAIYFWIFAYPWLATLSIFTAATLITVIAIPGLFSYLLPISSSNKNYEVPPVASSTTPFYMSFNDIYVAQSHQDSIFHVNVPLTDSKEFFGRELERAKILKRIGNGGSTAIVGSRHSGKTWLLMYLRLIAHEFQANVQIGYVNALDGRNNTLTGFVANALEALHIPPFSSNAAPNLALLDKGIHELTKQTQTPVLCIDNFDALILYKDFDRVFFEQLRALTNTGLVLILTSTKSISETIHDRTNASPFFNILIELKLKPFNAKEAENFAREKSKQSGFTEEEYDTLLYCARQESEEQWLPLHLQLTGQMLLEGKKRSIAQQIAHYDPSNTEYRQALKMWIADKT